MYLGVSDVGVVVWRPLDFWLHLCETAHLGDRGGTFAVLPPGAPATGWEPIRLQFGGAGDRRWCSAHRDDGTPIVLERADGSQVPMRGTAQVRTQMPGHSREQSRKNP